MITLLISTGKLHPTWGVFSLKWLEVKEHYKEILHMCHFKTSMVPFPGCLTALHGHPLAL